MPLLGFQSFLASCQVVVYLLEQEESKETDNRPLFFDTQGKQTLNLSSFETHIKFSFMNKIKQRRIVLLKKKRKRRITKTSIGRARAPLQMDVGIGPGIN